MLVSAVNVEIAELETFDSYSQEITPDHILASGSLPPGFPWTTIDGKQDYDFSRATIETHQREGYRIAARKLDQEAAQHA